MSQEKAVDYFDRHPSSNECHITSDGRVFHTIGSAQGFAQALPDNKVESFTRETPQVEAIDVVDPTEETGTEEGTDKGTDKGTEEGTEEGLDVGTDEGTDQGTDEGTEGEKQILDLDAALLAFDTATATYPEIVVFVKELKLASDSNKKEALVAAIVAAQETLKPQV